MHKVLVTMVMLAGAAAFAAEAKFEMKGDPKKGEATFKQLCVSCHGDQGKGDGPAGAALNPKPADFTDAKRAAAATDEYIYKMVRDGGAANGKSPLMVAWGPVLNDDQKIRDVAAYVRSLSKGAAAPEKSPAAGKAPKADAVPKKK